MAIGCRTDDTRECLGAHGILVDIPDLRALIVISTTVYRYDHTTACGLFDVPTAVEYVAQRDRPDGIRNFLLVNGTIPPQSMLGTSLWRVCAVVCGFVLLAGACGTAVADTSGGATPAAGGELLSTAPDSPDQPSVLQEQTRRQNDTEADGESPLADAGLDREVWENESVPLDAGDSRAPAGEIVGYEWEIDPPENTTAEPDCPSCRNTRFVPREPGTYAVTATVTDSNGRQSSDTLYVTVSEREPPKVSVSGPETLRVGESGTMRLSAQPRTHPLGSVIWRVDGDLRASLFLEENGFWRQQVQFDQPGTYTVSAAVRDRSGLSTVATHTVTVASVQRIETTIDTDQIGTQSGVLVNETEGYPITTTAYSGNDTRNVTGATSYTLTNGAGVATIDRRAGLPVLVPASYPAGGNQTVTVEAVYNPPGNRSFTATTSELLFDPIQNLSVALETDTISGNKVLVANRSEYGITTTATYVGGAGTDTVTARAEHAVVDPDDDVARITEGNTGRIGTTDARTDREDERSAGVTLDPQEPTAPDDPLELQASYPLAGVQYTHTATERVPVIGLTAQNLSVEIVADRIEVNETTTATATVDIGYVHEERDGFGETRALDNVIAGPLDSVLSTTGAIAAQADANGSIEVKGHEYGAGELTATLTESNSPLANTTLTGSDTVEVGFLNYEKTPVITGVPGRYGQSNIDQRNSAYQIPYANADYPTQLYVVYPYDPGNFSNTTEFQAAFAQQFANSPYQSASEVRTAASNGAGTVGTTRAGENVEATFKNESWYYNGTFSDVVTKKHNISANGATVYDEDVRKGFPVRITGHNSTVDIANNIYYSPLAPERVSQLRAGQVSVAGLDISNAGIQQIGADNPDIDQYGKLEPTVEATLTNPTDTAVTRTAALTVDGTVKSGYSRTVTLEPGDTDVTFDLSGFGNDNIRVDPSKNVGIQAGVHTDDGELVRVDDRASETIINDAQLTASNVTVRNVTADITLTNRTTYKENPNEWPNLNPYYRNKEISVTYDITNVGNKTRNGEITAVVPNIKTTSAGYGAPERDTQTQEYTVTAGETVTQTLTFNVSKRHLDTSGAVSTELAETLLAKSTQLNSPQIGSNQNYSRNHQINLKTEGTVVRTVEATTNAYNQFNNNNFGEAVTSPNAQFEITNATTEYTNTYPKTNDYSGNVLAEFTLRNTGSTTNTTAVGLLLDGEIARASKYTPAEAAYQTVTLAPDEAQTITLTSGGAVDLAPTTTVSVQAVDPPEYIIDSFWKQFPNNRAAYDSYMDTYIAESAVSARRPRLTDVTTTVEPDSNGPGATINVTYALINEGDRQGTYTVTVANQSGSVTTNTHEDLAPRQVDTGFASFDVPTTSSGVNVTVSVGPESWTEHVSFGTDNRTLFLSGSTGLDFTVRPEKNDLTASVTEPGVIHTLDVTKTDGDPLGFTTGPINGTYPLGTPSPPYAGFATVETGTNVYNNLNGADGKLGNNIIGQLINFLSLTATGNPHEAIEDKKSGATVTVEEGNSVEITAYTNTVYANDYINGEKLPCYPSFGGGGDPCFALDEDEAISRAPVWGGDFILTPNEDTFDIVTNSAGGGPWKGGSTSNGNTATYTTDSIDLAKGDTYTYEGMSGGTVKAPFLLQKSNWAIEVQGVDDPVGGGP